MLGEDVLRDMEWTSLEQKFHAKATLEKKIKLVGYNLSFRARLLQRRRKVQMSCVIEVFWVFAMQN